MDLLTEPWIDVFTVEGPATLSLLELARNRGEILDVASGDPLEDAAILRMLFAADIVSDGDLPGWLSSTAGQWELFSQDAPFWQNPQLREHVGERTVSPAATLPYRFAGNGSVLLDHHHNESHVRLSPAAAARALMMRQQFSVGGIQPFPETIFGLKSAKAAVAAPRPFTWIDAGNLAETLAANRRPGPVGAFHHSWPGGKPGEQPSQGGQADALTWQSRSMLLTTDSDGHVTGLSVTEGLRYGDDTDPNILPHTTFTQKKKTDPYTAWDVHADRPAWRQLLTAYATTDAPGVLAAQLPPGTRMRLAGLASFQSRIDGPITGSLPVPTISRADAAELDAAIGAVRKYLVGRLIAAGNELAPSSSPETPNAWWKRSIPTGSRWNQCIETIVRSTLTGDLSLAAAGDAMRAAVEQWIGEFATTVAAASPLAAVAATTPPTPQKEGGTRK
ncbi:type I-E CRISPR-associated protein Cse1/CasA [Rhodococcus hoagii]|nr:type I-E CRISPR-associated protein Cse1/CasA [Prescottella equi]MBM4654116.1 type I-E CRISPR-associated protein Cse1/CasA [Prescottella equi]MBM4719590.1 type I-E CRISPR-associated protein Cse1/CasA [Prescottella equi]NKR23389.1 type I-E CRISPR-associated protein Cse1/CasA [Prescottella equi]NKT56000.1 type I-E CRISPR-associated protein Cse1/CasA [Prescottella equi]